MFLGASTLVLATASSAAALTINTTESFESGADGWTVTGAFWQVGTPTGGPKAAHTGTKCAAISLTGVYAEANTTSISQFVSPTFTVPATSTDPRLTFWQWYNFYLNGGSAETGTVQIRVTGTTDWVTLSGPYADNSSGVWSEGSVDLSAYAGESVQVAFTYVPSGSYTGTGWYIDDVTVVSGAATLAVNTTDTFESGLGAWTISGPLWQVGVPTGGPEAAHGGTNCAALNLAGGYAGYSTTTISQLVSPTFTVPAATSDPRLTYWQWYQLYDNGGTAESATVQIRVSGSTTWTTVNGPSFGNNSGVWSEASVDLKPYAGKSVQIAFTYTPSGSYTSKGIYIDDVTLVSGATSLATNTTDTFESGLGSWTTSGPLWQVGKPTGGPGAAYSGSNCAALNLSGSIVATGSSLISQLVSPTFTVPAATSDPRLTFWQWYQFYANGGSVETGEVQIRVSGTTNWVTLAGPYVGANTPVWAEASIDLSAYAGKSVQVAFSYTPSGSYSSKGWFIDDITLVSGAVTLSPNVTTTFDAGISGWTMTGDLWQAGKPTGGPGAAHSGTNCVAMDLGGNYVETVSSIVSQFVSPSFVVPAATSDPRLTFWQWYKFYANGGSVETGQVQIRVAGTTDWVTLTGPYLGSNSPVWAEAAIDLSAYAGKTVQVAFTYTPSGSYGSAGWYIDDVTLVSGATTLATNTTQTFESGIGSWTMQGNMWQSGKPTGGPAAAHAGSYCLALNLAGSYTASASTIISRFVSPTFTVPAATSVPRLTFWQWYNFYANGGSVETGQVQIRVTGTTTWTTLTGPYLGSNSEVWAEAAIDLSAYAGKSVQVAFTYTPSGSYAATGWFIDDITLATGTAVLVPNITDTFETGLGTWTMLGNMWQTGKPTGGPKAAHAGSYCAALNLGGSYTASSSSIVSRLITPSFLVPDATQNPKFNFYKWYSFYKNGGSYESGYVQIRASGSTTWTTIGGPFTGASASWTSSSISLNAYAGKTVQVCFTYTPSGSYAGEGWFIDDVELVAPPKAQTITFPAIAAKTYGVAPFTISATASSKLPVTFTVASGPATISGSTVTITGAGTVSIKASQAGSPYYLAAPTVTNTFTVAKEAQTITFAALAAKTYGNAPFAVSATATSGLPVTFSVASGPATISGSTVTITGAGTVSIKAAQAGSTNFLAATSVTQSFTVAKASQTIAAWTPIAPQHYPGSVTITPPKASSGLAVTVKVSSGPATISGNVVTFTGTGTVTLAASQAGDANHLAATSVTTTISVSATMAGG